MLNEEISDDPVGEVLAVRKEANAAGDTTTMELVPGADRHHGADEEPIMNA